MGMKFSDHENFDAISKAWWRRINELRVIDEALKDGNAPLNLSIKNRCALDDSDEILTSDEVTQVLKIARLANVRRLKELASEFASIDVEVDRFHGIPDELADLVLSKKSSSN